MNDEELLRYSRHILLDEVGIEGQTRIHQAKVLVFGAGGLGSPALTYLVAAGCGHITVVDDDVVDLTNLQRQTIHTTDRVGMAKVNSVAVAAKALNPQVVINPVQTHADGVELEKLVHAADLVLDCTDNFSTRQAINAACVKYKKPLVSGSAIRWDAQVSVFDLRKDDSPCYACVYSPKHPPQEVKCSALGVFAPLTGITGAIQACEALKVIMTVGTPLTGRLLMLNVLHMEWEQLKIRKNECCPVCGNAGS
ncbi:MAG: HesA/MoeB/ThiF family protein [Saezia sp.]